MQTLLQISADSNISQGTVDKTDHPDPHVDKFLPGHVENNQLTLLPGQFTWSALSH